MIREEFEYIAQGPKKGPARKLVILIHGYGFNGHAMEKLAEEIGRRNPDALIIMPHGPEEWKIPQDESKNVFPIPQQLRGGRAPKDTEDRRQWFSLQGTLDDVKRRLYLLAADMNKFIDSQKDQLGIDDSKIAIVGFSQGGAVAAYTAFLRKTPMACLVMHSTMFVDSASLKSKLPTLYIFGRADEELSQKIYWQTIGALTKYLDEIDVHNIKGLSHRTSSESRRLTSEFIERKLGAAPRYETSGCGLFFRI